jgi:hypothetical protein
MKPMVKPVIVALAALCLVGCLEEGVSGVRQDPQPSPFEGFWQGSYSISPGGEQGDVQFVVTRFGTVTGTLFGSSSSFSGNIDRSGRTVGVIDSDPEPRRTFVGHMGGSSSTLGGSLNGTDVNGPFTIELNLQK